MPSLDGRCIAITGAGRGLGATLAMALADLGARPVLLGRDLARLEETVARIGARGGAVAGTIACDLTAIESCRSAAQTLVTQHADCDALVHNGALWSGAGFSEMDDQTISDLVSSAAIGAMVLTRNLLPHLLEKPFADILLVGSGTGLPHALLRGSATAFKAAKAAQHGFVEGLSEELRGTPVRVSGLQPGFIREQMPDEPDWQKPRERTDPLTNREVVETIIFMLSAPPNMAVRSLMIERNSDYLLWPNAGDDI